MLIIDSLFNFNFLSLWRGAENLSFFSSGTRHQFRGAEPGPVVGLIGAKLGKEGVEEFAHDGYHGLQPSFATVDQTLIEGPQMRLTPQGDQGRHVQRAAQMTTRTYAEVITPSEYDVDEQLSNFVIPAP